MARDARTRGLRDEAEVGPTPRDARELRRLSELRYRVADGEPDIRGWHVFASTGRELGTVSDLLVDVDAGEVVMLDVDLRRGDRHTLAPVRAAWIDHATRRVVLDAREVARADAAAGAAADDTLPVPALPRGGALSDDEVRRFNDDYATAYGDRGVDAERNYRLRRGEEELRFAAGPRRLLDPAAPAPAAHREAHPMAADPTLVRRVDPTPTAGAGRSDEAADINQTLADPAVADARRQAGDAGNRYTGDASLLAAAAATDSHFARPPERRVDRVDDASGLDDAQGIDPRELDARVRIDEGGTVDPTTPVAGVRYDSPDAAPAHSYGQPVDAYGPGYGDGRIGFDHVSRGPYSADDAPADDAAAEPRPVRYRSYDDRYAGPGGGR